jgi:hypothetical protein
MAALVRKEPNPGYVRTNRIESRRDCRGGAIAIMANEAKKNAIAKAVPHFPLYRKPARPPMKADNATIKAMPRRIDQKKRA